MATTRTVLIGALAALSLTIGACGGSDDDDAASDDTGSDVTTGSSADGGDAAADDGSGGDEAVAIDADCAEDAEANVVIGAYFDNGCER